MAEPNKVEVVISGISGIFPQCDNVEELKEFLFSKKNGITLDSSRWPIGEIKIILRHSNRKVISKKKKKTKNTLTRVDIF